MYDVNDYGRMMADPVRMHAYTEALRRAVKPGCVVVDVGTGTGIFALLAARFGARKVYAIDTNPCIQLARAVAEKNGLSDRIEFHESSIFDVELSERADVLVADCRGQLPVYERSLEIVAHARSRFLAPSGAMISETDHLFVALAEVPSLRHDFAAQWSVAGFDWEPCRQAAAATTRAHWSEDLTKLSDDACWAAVDYRTVTSPDVHGAVSVTAHRTGTTNCLVAWFRTTLLGGIELDSMSTEVYRPLILPLDPPIRVVRDDQIRVRVDALRSKSSYIFVWRVRTPREDRQHSNDGIHGQQLLEFSRMRAHLTPTGSP
jgi:protein arginine N-methyltransferase 1